MAFKVISLILILTIFQFKKNHAWVQDPWYTVYQSLKFERQHTSLAITSINRQINLEISGKITTLSWTLSQIRNQAEYIQTACAQRTLIEIEDFFATMSMIHECRNNALINVLKEKQMQQIDAEFKKVKEAENTCRGVIHYQPCADKVTKEVQERLLEIREETQVEANKIAVENAECVESRSDEMIGKLKEIEDNWKRC